MRFLIHYDFKVKGTLEIPAESEEDAVEYAMNHTDFDDFLQGAVKPPAIEVDYVTTIGKEWQDD